MLKLFKCLAYIVVTIFRMKEAGGGSGLIELLVEVRVETYTAWCYPMG
jgi:hypothetical protein